MARVARIALVHDYLLVMRGAERTFATMSAIWPDAPIYTLLYDAEGTNGYFRGRTVNVSPLRHLRTDKSSFRRLLPLFPPAAARMHPRGCEVVVSSSSAFAHGVRTDPDALHVCYCHAPFRYAWHDYAATVRDAPWYVRPLLARTLRSIRAWDVRASRRVTHYIANSRVTRERIASYWGREASVVHPPVDVDRFTTAEPEGYFLVVGEVTAHKRVEVALEAAARAGVPIKVAGGGPDLARLAATYRAGTEFLGRVPDRRVDELYARARALVVPNVEEFGIVAVEAQAAGRPVIGVDVGGTTETVVDGETGVLVPPNDPDAMAEAMRYVDFDAFSPAATRRNAARFAATTFRERLAAEVDAVVRTRAAPP